MSRFSAEERHRRRASGDRPSSFSVLISYMRSCAAENEPLRLGDTENGSDERGMVDSTVAEEEAEDSEKEEWKGEVESEAKLGRRPNETVRPLISHCLHSNLKGPNKS